MTPLVDSLTDREEQVLGLVATGHGRREIAHILGITLDTVGDHCDACRRKLGAATMAHAVAIYVAATTGYPDRRPGPHAESAPALRVDPLMDVGHIERENQ